MPVRARPRPPAVGSSPVPRLVHALHPHVGRDQVRADPLAVRRVVVVDARLARGQRAHDARREVARRQPPPCHRGPHVEEPAQVGGARRAGPGALVRQQVVALEDDDARAGADGRGVGHRVLDRVVEARHAHRGVGVARPLDARDGRVRVEGPGRAAPREGQFGIGHRGERGARQVEAVHGRARGDGRDGVVRRRRQAGGHVDRGGDGLGGGGLAGAGGPRKRDDEAPPRAAGRGLQRLEGGEGPLGELGVDGLHDGRVKGLEG